MTRVFAYPSAPSEVAFAQYYTCHQAAIAPFRTLSFGIDNCWRGGKLQPVIQRTVVATPFCRLLEFRTDTPSSTRRLLCAPLAGHRASQLRDMVQSLLEDGDVYVTDWLDARDIPVSAGPFTLDTNVLTLSNFIKELGTARLEIVAVCQASVPALAAIAWLSAHGSPEPSKLVLIAGPVDARVHPTRINDMAKKITRAAFLKNWTGFVPAGFPGAGRRIYPGFLQAAILNGESANHNIALASDVATALWCGAAQARSALHTAAAYYGGTLDMPAEFVAATLQVVSHVPTAARLLESGWRTGVSGKITYAEFAHGAPATVLPDQVKLMPRTHCVRSCRPSAKPAQPSTLALITTFYTECAGVRQYGRGSALGWAATHSRCHVPMRIASIVSATTAV